MAISTGQADRLLSLVADLFVFSDVVVARDLVSVRVAAGVLVRFVERFDFGDVVGCVFGERTRYLEATGRIDGGDSSVRTRGLIDFATERHILGVSVVFCI